MRMASHYSIKGFLRNTPNALLARCFAARGVLQDFDFKAIKETRIDPLFEAWMTLPEVQRAKLETELRAISDMSNEKGVLAIIDEAAFYLAEDGAYETFVAMLMALPGHHERAMTTFLDYPNLWKGATWLYHADTLSHWRKRKNLPKVKAATEPADTEALSAAIKSYCSAGLQDAIAGISGRGWNQCGISLKTASNPISFIMRGLIQLNDKNNSNKSMFPENLWDSLQRSAS